MIEFLSNIVNIYHYSCTIRRTKRKLEISFWFDESIDFQEINVSIVCSYSYTNYYFNFNVSTQVLQGNICIVRRNNLIIF